MADRNLPALAFGARPDVRSEVSVSALRAWNPGIQAATTDGDATISIMDPIGRDIWGDGVTSKRIGAALRSIGARDVTVTINSPGGDVFEGAGIYELLREHSRDRGKVTVQIMGLAASAASLIAMAADEILIGRSSFFMLHNSWVIAMGDQHDFAEIIDWLKPFDAAMTDVYAARSGNDVADVADMMKKRGPAGTGTWFGASDAIDNGFADGLLDEEAIGVGDEDTPSASIRAEKKFDLVAKRAGITRDDARDILRALKGGQPGAPSTGTPEAVDVETGISEILATLKGDGA